LTLQGRQANRGKRQGEALPFQGGTNEVVVVKMFKDLNPEQRKLFRVFWYTGKCSLPEANGSN
jgi:hypothetical protein